MKQDIRVLALKINPGFLPQSLIIVIVLCFLQIVFMKTIFDLQSFSRLSSYSAHSPGDKVAMVLEEEGKMKMSLSSCGALGSIFPF